MMTSRGGWNLYISTSLLSGVILISCGVGSVVCELDLKLLQVVFRHGERMPPVLWYYPNDPYANHSYYPFGNDDLTNEGKIQAYKVGEMLRKRYDDFLGPYYVPDEIHAQSTENYRTRISIQIVMAALFPPVGKQIWNEDLKWQPANVVFDKYDEDYLLFPEDFPQYVTEYTKFLSQDNVKQMIGKYRQVFDYITRFAGGPMNSTSRAYHLYNLLKEQTRQNLTLPVWTKRVFPKPLDEITQLDVDLRSYTNNLKRLNGGMLVRKFTDDIRSLRSENLQPARRKAFLFGAQKHNLAAIARTLGIGYNSLPEYGAAIVIETLRDRVKTDDYFVRIYVWTGVTEQLIEQKIPHCDEICPLNDFLSLVKEVLPNDALYYHQKELILNIHPAPYKLVQTHYVLFSSIPMIAVISIVLIVFWFKPGRKNGYQRFV